MLFIQFREVCTQLMQCAGVEDSSSKFKVKCTLRQKWHGTKRTRKYTGTSIRELMTSSGWIGNGCLMENEVVEVGDTFRLTYIDGRSEIDMALEYGTTVL